MLECLAWQRLKFNCHRLVLQIMRSLSTTEKVTAADHYVLQVSAGTDCALMIAFCVVIDELFND